MTYFDERPLLNWLVPEQDAGQVTREVEVIRHAFVADQLARLLDDRRQHRHTVINQAVSLLGNRLLTRRQDAMC